ncbi:MAG TPA: cell division protein FtsA, partial [Synergistaceae bacterium]|nr:cell division protein FtsA [Synergistaceae bacterium]
GTTGVAVYAEGKPKRLAVIPVGGDHVTNDLACVLRIPMSKADMLKREVSLDEEEDRLEDDLEFQNRGKTLVCTVREVVDVISSRLEELFGALVESEVAESGVSVLPAGIVLTGGVANTLGVERLVSHLMDMPVRIGRPLDVHRMPPERNGVEYASAAGIIRYVVEKERNPQRYLDPFQGPGEPRRKVVHPVPDSKDPWIKGNPFAGAWAAIKKTLKELF